MNFWWRDYEHDYQTKVNPMDRVALEAFTGKIPILLRALGAVSKPQPVSVLTSETILGHGAMGMGPAEPAGDAGDAQSTFVQNLTTQVIRLPDVQKIVGSINRYASRKFSELGAEGMGNELTEYAH